MLNKDLILFRFCYEVFSVLHISVNLSTTVQLLGYLLCCIGNLVASFVYSQLCIRLIQLDELAEF